MSCVALLNEAEGRVAVRLTTAERCRWRLERRRRCRSRSVPYLGMEHTPPSCGSRHTEAGCESIRRYQTDLGRL